MKSLFEGFLMKIIVFKTESVTITPKDTRWVGAWWIGFFVSSGLLLISSIPFWFLPRSLPKHESEEKQLAPVCDILNGTEEAQNNNFKLTEIAKGTVLFSVYVCRFVDFT